MKAARLFLLLAIGGGLGCSDATGPAEDGFTTWTLHLPQTSGRTILDAAYGRGRFVVVGLGGTVSWSENGSRWEAVEAGFGNDILTGLTYTDGFGGVFVAATHDSEGLNRTVATSPDGTTWERHSTPRPEPLREVACAEGVCVAVGDEGAVARSTDLETWEDVSFTGGGFRWISVIHADGRFVISGGREQIAHSVDGRSWSVTRLGLTPDLQPDCTLGPECNDIDDIAYSGTGYVAVTHPTMGVWASDDLERWEPRETGLEVNGSGFWSVLYTDDAMLVGGGGGKLAVSYDRGVSWRPIDAGFGQHGIWATAYGDGLYLIAGDWGALAVSRRR